MRLSLIIIILMVLNIILTSVVAYDNRKWRQHVERLERVLDSSVDVFETMLREEMPDEP